MTDLIFDAHLDLSMNAMEWNRDLTQTVMDIREREKRFHCRKCAKEKLVFVWQH
jgi:membrane dipeptidase